MPGPGGINPTLSPNPTQAPLSKGVDPNLVEGKEQTQQPNSVFHALDNSPQDGVVNKAEAKDTIFSQIQTGTHTETLNVSSGSFSFKSLFETAAQKFQDIQYETTQEGVKSVDTQITSQVQKFNTDAAALYNQYVQQRNNEAKGELSDDKKTLEYKDAAGQTFRSEKVDIKTTDEGTFYKDSNGKTLYFEDAEGSQTTSMYNSDGKITSSSTRNDKGEVTDSATYTYNDKGQRTSRTYTSNGQTLTSEYTYNNNGTIASEIVKDADGNVLETTKFDKNGKEVSYNASINDGTSTTDIKQEFNKKGNLTTSTHDVSMNDNSASSKSTETFRNNGNLKTRFTQYNTNDPNALNKTYNTQSSYRRGGELKYETVETKGNDGTSTTSKTKFRGSGETRNWNKTEVHNGRTNTTFKTNFNMDNEISGAKVTEKNKNTTNKGKIITFDNDKNKAPQGYTAVKGFENHYSNSKGEVFVFVEGDNGKPKPIRDHSSTARLHEARLKRELNSEDA